MTKYEELVYLQSAEHKKECCGFANFLAEAVTNYLECSREDIVFTVFFPETRTIGASRDCTEATIKETEKGFVWVTMEVAIKDEKTVYPSVSADIYLQKLQDGFLIRIDRLLKTHFLSEEDAIAMSEFCATLFNFFTDRSTR